MRRELGYLYRSLRLLLSDPLAARERAATLLRLAASWRRSLDSGNDAIGDQVPWITFEAREFLDRILRPDASVFEYGSGGSTLFYAKHAGRVVTIEHDPAWAARVGEALAVAGQPAGSVRCVPPDPEPATGSMSTADPRAYRSSHPPLANRTLRAYASSIDAFEDASFDLVAVDGRARPSCVLHALGKVKVGGYLMLDDSERIHYREARQLLSSWSCRDFFGPGPYLSFFFQTSFWQRPSSSAVR